MWTFSSFFIRWQIFHLDIKKNSIHICYIFDAYIKRNELKEKIQCVKIPLCSNIYEDYYFFFFKLFFNFNYSCLSDFLIIAVKSLSANYDLITFWISLWIMDCRNNQHRTEFKKIWVHQFCSEVNDFLYLFESFSFQCQFFFKFKTKEMRN